jgi:hypothetical protein
MRSQTGISREIYSSLVIVRLLSMKLILLLMSLVYYLYCSPIKFLVYAAVYSEHGEVNQCDFKPGSVERSIDPYKEDFLNG